jgi:hypothetical protein
MKHSFIALRFKTRPRPAVNGHSVIPGKTVLHVITGLVPVIPLWLCAALLRIEMAGTSPAMT